MTVMATSMLARRTVALPDGWRWARLRDVAAINPPRLAGFRRDPDAPTTFVPMSALDAVRGVIAEPEIRPYADVANGYTFFAEGDVLFAKITPCMQNGKHAVARGLRDGVGFASTEFHVIRAGVEVLADWIHGFVRQPSVLLEAMNHFTGAVGQQRVPDDFLKGLLVPLPPRSEQERIVAALREHMKDVEMARAAARQRLEASLALPGAYLRDLYEGHAVSRCPRRRLGEILIPHKEIIHPGDREGGTAEFVGLEHIESHTGRRLGSLTLDLARLTGRKPTFRRGQIVYGYLRPYLNKVWVAEFDGCSSVDQFAFDVRSDIADLYYVAWFMRSPTYLRRSAVVTTTGQLPRIGTEEIAAVEIGLPPIEQQRAIGREIEFWFAARQELCDLLNVEVDAIDKMPAALLRQAFAGTL